MDPHILQTKLKKLKNHIKIHDSFNRYNSLNCHDIPKKESKFCAESHKESLKNGWIMNVKMSPFLHFKEDSAPIDEVMKMTLDEIFREYVRAQARKRTSQSIYSSHYDRFIDYIASGTNLSDALEYYREKIEAYKGGTKLISNLETFFNDEHVKANKFLFTLDTFYYDAERIRGLGDTPLYGNEELQRVVYENIPLLRNLYEIVFQRDSPFAFFFVMKCHGKIHQV